MLWAEAQEQIVKLKRQLVKSQEKTVTFASKLTKAGCWARSGCTVKHVQHSSVWSGNTCCSHPQLPAVSHGGPACTYTEPRP